ncbi:MAG: hypothetical protein AB8H03_05610 [Saprospiraceae bacterium]
MKNIILFLVIAFSISCNSNSSSSQNQYPAEEASENSIDQPIEKVTPPKTNNIFEGMYSYMADANMFISCDQKIKMPVEMKGEYLNLEKQYLRTVDGGTEVYVKLKGAIKKIPAMEGDKKINALVLEEVLELTKDRKCP